MTSTALKWTPLPKPALRMVPHPVETGPQPFPKTWTPPPAANFNVEIELTETFANKFLRVGFKFTAALARWGNVAALVLQCEGDGSQRDLHTFKRTPLVDAPSHAIPVDQWIAQIQKSNDLMHRMAEMRVMMMVYEMYGFKSLAHKIREELEGFQIEISTAANTSPVIGNRLEIKATNSEASPAETVTQLITNLLDGKNERESAQELRRIGLPHAARAIPVLIGRLNMEMGWIALMRDIISALGQLRAKEAIPTLERILHETYESRDKFGTNGDWWQLQDILLRAFSEIDPNYHPEPRTGTMPRTEPLGWHHGIADHVFEYEIDEIESAWQHSAGSRKVVDDFDIERMLNLLRYGDADVKRRTIALFENMGDAAHAAIPQLIERAMKGNFAAIDTLGRMRAKESKAFLENLLRLNPQDTFNRGMNVHIYAALRNMGRAPGIAADVVETDDSGYLAKKLESRPATTTTPPQAEVIPLDKLLGISESDVATYIAGIANQDPAISSDWVDRCSADREFKEKLMRSLQQLVRNEVPQASKAYDHVRRFSGLELD